MINLKQKLNNAWSWIKRQAKRFKRWIIALIVGGAVLASSQVMPPEGAAPYMTYSEYQDYIEMMNYEVQRIDKQFENVDSKQDLIKRVHDRVSNRKVKKGEEAIKMHNKNYSTSTYMDIRKDLINKAENSLR